jgi:hypothetical protein
LSYWTKFNGTFIFLLNKRGTLQIFCSLGDINAIFSSGYITNWVLVWGVRVLFLLFPFIFVLFSKQKISTNNLNKKRNVVYHIFITQLSHNVNVVRTIHVNVDADINYIRINEVIICIRISSNEHFLYILVFSVIFWYLLKYLLNNFENSSGLFLVF